MDQNNYVPDNELEPELIATLPEPGDEQSDAPAAERELDDDLVTEMLRLKRPRARRA